MAAPILIRSSAVLAKIEATAGVDPVPTAAANAVKVSNLSITPLEVEMADRATTQPYLGNNDQVLVAGWTRTEFEVEIAGAGAAGTVPQYGPLLRACGFSETVSAGTSVVYAPISTAFESLTLYVNVGGVLYKSSFAAGSVALTLNSRAIPQFRFSFTGLYAPVTDSALPAATYRDVKPVAVSKLNTPSFSLLGYAAVMQQLTLDMKNTVIYRNLVNHESVRLTDRKPDGSVRIEATKVADKDWWTPIRAGAVGPLALTHGTVAGNTIEIACPGVQMTSPGFDDDNGVQMFRTNLVVKPVNGNDELTITVK